MDQDKVLPRTRRVRSRVGRRIAGLLIGGIALCTLVVYLRDAAAIKSECRHLDLLMTPVREHLEKTGRLPLRFPTDPNTKPDREDVAYVDPEVIRWSQSTDKPVLIAYLPGYGLILRSNGHAVAIFNDGEITIEWLPNKEVGPRLDAQRRATGIPPRDQTATTPDR